MPPTVVRGARCTIFPKLCTVIELIEALKKVRFIFSDPTHSFSYRVHGKTWRNWRTRGFSAVRWITSNLKHECRIVRRIKALEILEIGQVEIFDIFGAVFPTPVVIEVKFCTAKRTHVPVGRPKFDVNIGATSRPCGAKNLILGLWVNLIPQFAA